MSSEAPEPIQNFEEYSIPSFGQYTSYYALTRQRTGPMIGNTRFEWPYKRET